MYIYIYTYTNLTEYNILIRTKRVSFDSIELISLIVMYI